MLADYWGVSQPLNTAVTLLLLDWSYLQPHTHSFSIFSPLVVILRLSQSCVSMNSRLNFYPLFDCIIPILISLLRIHPLIQCLVMWMDFLNNFLKNDFLRIIEKFVLLIRRAFVLYVVLHLHRLLNNSNVIKYLKNLFLVLQRPNNTLVKIVLCHHQEIIHKILIM